MKPGRQDQRSRDSGGMAAALTPLLDTLFLLLFSLLALSEARSSSAQEVRLHLPEVEQGPESTGNDRLRVVFEIESDSAVRIEGSPTPLASRAELDAALAQRLGDALPEELVIEIRADRDARHGTAVQLLQHLRVRGFVNVRLLATGAPETADWLEEEVE